MKREINIQNNFKLCLSDMTEICSHKSEGVG